MKAMAMAIMLFAAVQASVPDDPDDDGGDAARDILMRKTETTKLVEESQDDYPEEVDASGEWNPPEEDRAIYLALSGLASLSLATMF